MENNILTAKEWLEKEELYSCSKEYRNKIELAAEEVDMFIYMEKYANYKNRILEDRIKEFAQFVKINCDSYIERMYNKHFNIENKQ